METRGGYYFRLRMGTSIVFLYLTLSTSLIHCDAERTMKVFKGLKHKRSLIDKQPKKLKTIKHFHVNPTLFLANVVNPTLDSSNAQPYSVSSPNSLPPYESLAPIPLAENSPPFCVNPPTTPSTTTPTPIGFTPLSSPYNYPSPLLPPPTPTSTIPGPPGSTVSPPYFEPSPPYYIPSPAGGIIPGPPTTVPSPSGGTFPSPPTTVPSPSGGGVPSPTVFYPPVVFPPPSVPPPPNTGPSITLWCVAKPSVPDPIVQEAMNYACGSGADCASIQPNGPCFEPNTVYAHASYAFNSFWQKTKVAGGSCDFGGAAILVSVDPSYDGCHFVYF